MPTPDEILRSATRVVVQDYPSRDVPDALARAGLMVTIYGGPSEADVLVTELSDGAVRHTPVGRYPDRADVLYTYRPIAEIDRIISEALRLRAHTVWRQPLIGSANADAAEWRRRIEGAGLAYLDDPAIDEVAARLER